MMSGATPSTSTKSSQNPTPSCISLPTVGVSQPNFAMVAMRTRSESVFACIFIIAFAR